MRTLFLGVLLVVSPAVAWGAVNARPVPDDVATAAKNRLGARAYVPTRMLIGFRLMSSSIRNGVLLLQFRNKAGRHVVWSVRLAPGACAAGKEKTFQLAGNKVYWASSVDRQFAWRCVVSGGRRLRLEASTKTPPTKLADVGLGRVVASGKRL